MQIKVLFACSHKDTAAALCKTLCEVEREIAGEATDLAGALTRAAVTKPDILVLEHAAGEEESAWQILALLGDASPATRVLLLCESYTHHMVIGFIRRGASGCLLQSSNPSLHAKAVRTVHRGEPWFGRTALLQALRSQIAPEPDASSTWVDEPGLLTAREREILGLIGNALTNKEIARQLKISDKTVKTHLHNIYVKLHKGGRYKAFLSNYRARPAPVSARRGLLPPS